jgi:hypothetical protein
VPLDRDEVPNATPLPFGRGHGILTSIHTLYLRIATRSDRSGPFGKVADAEVSKLYRRHALSKVSRLNQL